jgi:hypothetical protein
MNNIDKECQIYSCALIDILLKNMNGNIKLMSELKILKEKQCKCILD